MRLVLAAAGLLTAAAWPQAGVAVPLGPGARVAPTLPTPAVLPRPASSKAEANAKAATTTTRAKATATATARAPAPAPAASAPVAAPAAAPPAATIATASARPATAPAAAAERALLLAVRVNGVLLGATVQAAQRGDELALAQDACRELTLAPVTVAPWRLDGDDQRYLPLAAWPALYWELDEATQTLRIEAPPAVFAGRAGAAAVMPQGAPSASQWGGFGNYDVQWRQSRWAGDRGGMQEVDALLEIGSFAPVGDGSSSLLMRQTERGTQWVRLDTGWTVEQPDSMRRLRVGDAVGQAGAWGRAMRFGGVQWGTDFRLRPGFVSYPLPSMQGEASLPSTVDVYVNNSQRVQGDVPAGPFDLTQIPIVTGQGEIRTVVRDLLGREQVIVQPYYVSPALLKPGLRAYSVEVGALREDYGLESFRYGRGMVAATDRLGLSERFTRELRAELLADQQAVGATGVWLLPTMGTAHLSLVGSHDRRAGSGWMVGTGADRQGLTWSGGVQLGWRNEGFTQVGQPSGNAPRRTVSASMGTMLAGGSLGLSWIQQAGNERMAPLRLASSNYSRAIGPWAYLSLVLLRDMERGGSTTVALNLSRVLDAFTSANAGVVRTRDAAYRSDQASLQIQRPPPAGPGFGYELALEGGDADRRLAVGQWRTRHADLEAGVGRLGAITETRAGVSGSAAWLGGDAFLARHIEGSFAVVEVGDYEGVGVLHDNQPVATTNAKGRALVTGLRGYERNRISIEPGDLPIDAEVGSLEMLVTPPARSGTRLQFEVLRQRSASLRLVDATGRPVPAGSLIEVVPSSGEAAPAAAEEGGVRRFPVGFEGRAYVSGLSDLTLLRVQWPQGDCRAAVMLPRDLDELPDLGSVPCLGRAW